MVLLKLRWNWHQIYNFLKLKKKGWFLSKKRFFLLNYLPIKGTGWNCSLKPSAFTVKSNAKIACNCVQSWSGKALENPVPMLPVRCRNEQYLLDHPVKTSANFSQFLTPTPLPSAVFYYYPSANLANFYPPPTKKCPRLKWMVPREHPCIT